jgi:hypothetical protein
MNDYYSILGISESASFTEIKNAYRKLSKKFHPDVNQGDKYFEERFKEIQSAYEILSDSNKRIKYDSERTILRGNNARRNNDEYYSKEENLKRQKEEIKKREEELKRKEEEFRRKEQTYSKPEEKIESKRSSNNILYLLLVPLVIILIVILNKSGRSRIQTVKESTALFEEKEKESDLPDLPLIPSSNASDLSLKKIKNSDILNNLVKGQWEGSAYQSNINESWAIKLIFNKESDEFEIIYPSLNCTGYWKAKSVTNSEIEFIEMLRTGQHICNDGGNIVLRQLTSDRMQYLFYWPSVTTLDSKGEIKRVK